MFDGLLFGFHTFTLCRNGSPMEVVTTLLRMKEGHENPIISRVAIYQCQCLLVHHFPCMRDLGVMSFCVESHIAHTSKQIPRPDGPASNLVLATSRRAAVGGVLQPNFTGRHAYLSHCLDHIHQFSR